MRSNVFPDEYHDRNGVLFPRDADQHRAMSGETEIEKKIADIVSSSNDVSSLSTELRSRIEDHATLYEFSPKRNNLLRPLSGLLKGKILEIGAGTGAITRFLGESGAEVIGVERSSTRAAIARSRNRDLGNVRLVSDDIENISFRQKFDVVTLIGAVGHRNAFELSPELLSIARRNLKDGGTFVLAMENQLGLKYFAGAKEDDWPSPFIGINDQLERSVGFALGRTELRTMLAEAGFKSLSWFYPFPDFRLPTTILSEAAFQNPGAHDLSPLFSGSNFDDPKGARPGTFSLDRAWGLIARNGLAEDLANSFLIVCRTSDAGSRAPAAGDKAIAWHYSVDRKSVV